MSDFSKWGNFFGNMFDMITGNKVVLAVIFIVAIIAVAVLIAWWRSRKDRIPKTSRANRHQRLQDKAAPVEAKEIKGDISADDVDGDETDGEAGKYPAYICTLDGGFDFDYIPHPCGDVFQADTSMPHSGACYLVKEVKNEGKIGYEPYDPRTAPLLSSETPTKAWFATHWSIVRDVYGVPAAWWKSSALWIAGIAGSAAFIIALVRVGS